MEQTAALESRTVELTADLRSPGAARRIAAKAARDHGADAHSVAVCVSEAVTNVVQHAYPGRTNSGPVRLVLDAHPERGFAIDVVDDGIGFTPRADKAGLGLGIPLIEAVSEHVDIRSTGKGTCVSMSFRSRAPR